MSWIPVGSCPKCGAPIYAESPWFGIVPPPPCYTCQCLPRGQTVITQTTNEGAEDTSPDDAR